MKSTPHAGFRNTSGAVLHNSSARSLATSTGRVILDNRGIAGAFEESVTVRLGQW